MMEEKLGYWEFMQTDVYLLFLVLSEGYYAVIIPVMIIATLQSEFSETSFSLPVKEKVQR